MMRTFEDPQGQSWQAGLLEASYGDILLIFSPLSGGEVRQRLLASDNMLDAEAEVTALGEDGLLDLLAEAKPWDSEAGVARARAAYGDPTGTNPVVTSITRRKTT